MGVIGAFDADLGGVCLLRLGLDRVCSVGGGGLQLVETDTLSLISVLRFERFALWIDEIHRLVAWVLVRLTGSS